METTICDISAWQFYRTPPQLRSVELDPELARARGYSRPARRGPRRACRRNERPSERSLSSRLLGELKGIALPVHVIVGPGSSAHKSDLVIPHRIGNDAMLANRVSLGNGLFVLSPEALLCSLPAAMGRIAIAKMMFEACGIFSVLPRTARLACVVSELMSQGVIAPEAYRGMGTFAFCDERGVPLPTLDPEGDPMQWTPCFDRHRRLTDLWKRPPLTDVESLLQCAGRLGLGERSEVMRAIAMVRNGAASPEEVRANILLCSGSWNGGESWGDPYLNRRIAYTPEAARLAGSSSCVADSLWLENKSVLEVLGEGFHADTHGFREVSGRTAALESMGYTVAEIIHGQMADLEQFDALLPVLAGKLGFEPCRKTPAFLRRRAAMHRELFGVPYEADVQGP